MISYRFMRDKEIKLFVEKKKKKKNDEEDKSEKKRGKTGTDQTRTTTKEE